MTKIKKSLADELRNLDTSDVPFHRADLIQDLANRAATAVDSLIAIRGMLRQGMFLSDSPKGGLSESARMELAQNIASAISRSGLGE